jgi:purine-nucleoside phosphorylase
MTAQEFSNEDPTVQRVREFAPECALVLGSGLGSLVERAEVSFSLAYREVPGLPVSKVPGHEGTFYFGELGGVRVVLAAGRVHLYEGWTAREVTAGVRWLAAGGVSHLVLTNAAGSLREHLAPGTWMLLADHINLQGTSPLLGGPNFVDLTEVYSGKWRQRFLAAAERVGVPLGEGVYAALPGPQYETPAEIRWLRTVGADAVGMSTVLEAIQARALGLEVTGFSCLTNWGAGLGQTSLDHAEVTATGKAAAGDFFLLWREAVAANGA